MRKADGLKSSGMGVMYSRQIRSERIIATGRLVLAAFFLLAIWMDPSEPSRYARITYGILAGYLGYALVLAIVNRRLEVPLPSLQVITHALDLMIFVVIMFFSQGPSSPFFVYFVFSMVCATVRWQWRGTVWTASVSLVAVIALGYYPAGFFHDPDFKLQFIIRIVYLAVVAALLIYLGAYEQKLFRERSKLAAWPRSISTDIHVLVREMLEYAASVLGAPRLILMWEEEEEPWLHLASWSQEQFTYTREPPGAFGGIVAEPLAGRNFFCADARTPQSVVIYSSPAGLKKWYGSPLHPSLQTRFVIGIVLSLRLDEKNLEGYLLALDKRQMTPDDLVLGQIVAREVTTRLNHFLLLKELKESATKEERIRLARDLHDGLLQSLTGAALQLETVHRLMEEDPQAAGQRLSEIQQLIAAEQRDLRSQIQELKPVPARTPEADYDLSGRMKELAKRIKRHWGIPVELNLENLKPGIPGVPAQEIYFIVHESLINAARHAGASALHVEAAVKDNRVCILVADNGQGFPFQGRYDHDDLTTMNCGPMTLKERIASLGGSLTIDSGRNGSRLEITLPIMENGG